MKTAAIFTFSALLMAGFASCTKDASEPIGGGVENASNKFTFVLPAQSNVVTYAHDHAVEAIGDESKFDLTKTSIYIFGATGNLEAIVASDIQAGTHTDGRPTATIEIDDEWDWNGTKTFFMVSNTNKEGGSTLPTAVPTLPDVITVDDFKDLMTGAMATTTVDGVEVADAAFASTGGMILADYKQVTNIETAPATELELHRTVARIDIHNDVTFGKVTIKSISVSDANLNGYMFATDRGVATSGLVKGDIRGIAVSGNLVDGVATENIWGTTNKEDDTHKYQKQAAVAYLYPTNLKAGNATGTELTLVGEVNGIPAVYTLNKEDINGDPVDVEIKANTRYIISAIDQFTKTFILTIADWDEGESLIGRPGNSGFGIASAGTPMTNATFNAANNSLAIGDPSAAFTATLNIKGSSAKGVTAEVISQTGTGFTDVTGIVTAVAAYDGQGVTYATPYFNYVLTVEFPGDEFADDANITADIKLTDVASGATTYVRLYHDGSTVLFGDEVWYPTEAGFLPAVKLGETYWAPVNVGATQMNVNTIDNSTIGNFYQWGRNHPFTYSDVTNNFEKKEGPVSVSDANSTYSNFFIFGENRWFTDEFDDVMTFWNTQTQGPCPNGWRLPDPSERENLLVTGGYTASFNENHVSFSDTEGNSLIVPFGGAIWRTGTYYSLVPFDENVKQFAMWWTSSVPSGESARIFRIEEDKIITPLPVLGVAYGVNVRCVKDVTP